MKQPVLLCYNLNGFKARNVHMTAMRMKIRVRNVAKKEYALPLSVLLGAGSADTAQKRDPAVDAERDAQCAQTTPRRRPGSTAGAGAGAFPLCGRRWGRAPC